MSQIQLFIWGFGECVFNDFETDSSCLFFYVTSREDINKKQERRERLRQWQEKMNTDRFSDQRNQQGNKGRSKKKLTKSVKGRRRSSSVKLAGTEMEGDRDSPSKEGDPALFENDDYFEIPMDLESDSTGTYTLIDS